MSPLEERLVALGAALDSPPAPDLVPGVTARLRPLRPSRRRAAVRVTRRGLGLGRGRGVGRGLAFGRGRGVGRGLALGLGIALLAAGAAMAVTPARHAVLDLLGLRSARVERVPRLPPARTRVPLGRPIPLASARTAAGFRALLPSGGADRAYLAGRRLSLRARGLVISELEGQGGPVLLKQIGPGTTARPVKVNGKLGAFISGRPHDVYFLDRRGVFRKDAVHVAGDVLLWSQGNLVLRIEGARTLARAMALARTLR